MARPVTYNEKFVEWAISQVDEYLKTCGREQTKLPKVKEFAEYIGVNDDTLNELSKKYPKLSAAIKRIMNRQENTLIDDGLYGGKEINPTMAIFLLKVNHGMIETERKMLAGDKENPLNIQLTDEQLKRIVS